ncbi:MAG: leucine-rich repeat domain-containing protein [Treponema sp.]|nr:leucine-rich repeat domain-containing protein [Treponema sp.]
MKNLMKTAILLLIIIGITGCPGKETDNENAITVQPIEQNTRNETIFTDFSSNSVSNNYTQVGDFVIVAGELILYTGNATHVEIPADLEITRIGQAFSHTSVVSIVIPEQVREIESLYGGRAFADCFYLQSITVVEENQYFASADGVLFNKDMTVLIHFPQKKTGSYILPDGIMSISSNQFFGNTGLTSITIPDSTIRISDFAFSGCSGLVSINVDQNNPNYASVDGVLFNKAVTELMWFPHGKSGSYTMPNTVTSIKQNAISDRTRITSVSLSNSITNITNGTFSRCSSLTSVTIPDSVTTIGDSVFSHCSRLTTINIPRNVTSMGDNIFTGCTSLSSITVDRNNTTFASAEGVLFNKNITELIYFPLAKSGSYTIPNTITNIRDLAFSERTALTSIVIPASITVIGKDAFFRCNSLTSITVDDNNPNYASVDGVLFNKNMTQLIRFPRGKTGRYIIPNTVVLIGNNAFAGTSGLTAVTIPDSVTSIGDTAFAGTGLTSLTIPNSVTSIGNSAFADNRNLTIIGLPDNYRSMEDGKFGDYFFYGCTGLRQIIAGRNNRYYTTVDGVLFNKDKTQLIRFPQGKTGSYTIPDTVTSIAYKAFYGASGLTSVNIPSSVINIGNFAFDGCTSLTSVNIPDGVINIGMYAFARCTNLASVNISASVAGIGDFVFYETGLRFIAIDQNNRSFTLVDGMLFRKDMTEPERYLAAVR